MAPSLRLSALGPIELFEAGNRAIPLPGRKARAILAILAASPGPGLPRALLAAMLWASEETRARQSLRQELSALRRALGAEAAELLLVEGGTVRLDRTMLDIDTDRLMAAAGGDLDAMQAAALLAGREFATELDGENNEILAEWLERQRTRFREASLALLARLARTLSEQGRHEEALATALALHALDPLCEATHRLVIAEEALVSGRASAMARYETFRQHLRDELAVQPEAETRRLLDAIRGEPNPAGAPAFAIPGDAAPLTLPAGADRPATGDHRLASAAPPLHRRQVVQALGASALAGAGMWAGWRLLRSDPAIAYAGEENGSISVAVLPYDVVPGNEPLAEMAKQLHDRMARTWAQTVGFSAVDIGAAATGVSISEIGRVFRVRYLLQVSFENTPFGRVGYLRLWETATGIAFFNEPMRFRSGPEPAVRSDFNRQVLWTSMAELQLHRARTLEPHLAETTAGLVIRAQAAQMRAARAAAEPGEVALWQAALAREPDHFPASLGLVRALLREIARGAADADPPMLDRIGALVERMLAAAPRAADVLFRAAILDLLRGDLAKARKGLEEALAVSPAHFGASLAGAQIRMLEGDLLGAVEALRAMIPKDRVDIYTAENAAAAAEAGLVADLPEEALEWADLSLRANASAARSHALRAAALQLLARTEEALRAAATARRLDPRLTPERFAMRGHRGAGTFSARYNAGHARYVEAYRQASTGASARE